MAREKVTFSANVPTQVILDSLGTMQAGRDGTPEFRYFLGGDKIMWVPQEVHDAIEAGGVTEGSLVTIARQVNKAGDEQWKVALGKGARSTAASRAPSRSAPAASPATAFRNGAPVYNEPQPAPPAELATNAADQYANALHDAVNLATQTAAYAKEQGLPLNFTGEDIRCMASTLYIGGRR